MKPISPLTSIIKPDMLPLGGQAPADRAKNTVLILGEQSLSTAELTRLLGEPCRNGSRAEGPLGHPHQELGCLEQTLLGGRRREEGSE